MAGLSGLPAMDIDPVGFGAQNSLLQAQAAQAQQQLQTSTALAPYAIAEAKDKSRLQDITTWNATLAKVAQDASAADPEEAPDVWDRGMKAAAEAGVPSAGQYVGHYRSDLAEHVSSAFGAPGGQTSPTSAASGTDQSGAGGANPQMLDMQIAQLPPQQVQQSLGNINRAVASFNNVKDQQSWNSEIEALRQSGVPVDKILPSLEWNPLNYAAAARLLKNVMPYREALERASARMQAGLSAPPIPRNIVKTDAGIYEVNPFAPSGTPAIRLAGTPSYERTYSKDAQGRPIVFDKFSGQSMVSNPVDQNTSQGMPLTDFATRMTQAENSTGNRSAQNPNSTAAGNGQFINSTWLSTVRTVRPELAGLSDGDLLKLRADPAFAAEMTAQNARSNGAQLQQSGFPVTSTTLGLAHRFGTPDAMKIMQASPDTPLANILSKPVMTANPDLAKQTAGGYLNTLSQQMGNDPVDIGTGAQSVRTLSPEEESLQEKILPAQFEKAKESYDSATNLQFQLKTMQDQLGQMGTSGFMAPGTGDTARTNFAKRLNSLATAYLGIDANDKRNLPFDPDKVANAQDIQKGTVRLGFDLARQLGSREAMMIVQQAVGAVPGIENTPRGARLIFGALGTAAQRQVDYYTYLNDWAQHHPNTMGADVAFNKAYPVARYATQALLAGVPQPRIDYLKSNPKTASQFDDYYGSGLSKVVLGQR